MDSPSLFFGRVMDEVQRDRQRFSDAVAPRDRSLSVHVTEPNHASGGLIPELQA